MAHEWIELMAPGCRSSSCESKSSKMAALHSVELFPQSCSNTRLTSCDTGLNWPIVTKIYFPPMTRVSQKAPFCLTLADMRLNSQWLKECKDKKDQKKISQAWVALKYWLLLQQNLLKHAFFLGISFYFTEKYTMLKTFIYIEAIRLKNDQWKQFYRCNSNKLWIYSKFLLCLQSNSKKIM